jgi:hypothetical protein
MALPEPYARTIFGHAIFEAPTTPLLVVKGHPHHGALSNSMLPYMFFSTKICHQFKALPELRRPRFFDHP